MIGFDASQAMLEVDLVHSGKAIFPYLSCSRFSNSVFHLGNGPSSNDGRYVLLHSKLSRKMKSSSRTVLDSSGPLFKSVGL